MGDNVLMYTTALCADLPYNVHCQNTLSHNTFELAPVIRCRNFSLLYHKMNLLRPRVMVCIQPLAKGDMFCRMRILNALREIQKQGTAILMITASVSDTMDISDRLLVVEQGKVAASYDRSEFKRIVR